MILNSLSTRLRWTQGIRVHSRLSRARLLFSVLLPLAFSVQPCHAAVQQAWVAKYNSGPGSTNPPAGVALDADANVYVAGSSTRSSPPYDLDYVVIKYSPTGEQLWLNRFGSPGVDERIKAMSISTNGDVFVTGTANTIKYFSSGLLAWTAPYAASDIKADTNGNAYVTGFRTDAYSTAKLDENGSNVWVRLWDKGPWDDVSQKIALDKVGNVFVLGLATFNCDMFGCYFQPWAIKYSPSGSLLWSLLLFQGYYQSQSQYKGTACDDQGNLYFAVNLWGRGPRFYPWANRQITSDGGYGWSQELNDFEDLEGVMALTLDGTGNVYYTGIDGRTGALESHKLTSNGTNLWKALYLPSPGLHRGNGIVADSEGNAYVTGQSPGNATGNDYATIKYGTNGQQLWVQRYTEAGNSDDQAHAIAVSPNGDVYVTGFSNPTNGLYEITTIKYVQMAPIEKKSNGNILINLCGTPGSNYTIQACSTLTNWTNIGSVTCAPSGLYTFEDTNAPTHQQRFYRTFQE